MSENTSLLRVRDLRTEFHTEQGVALAADGVSFDLEPGKTLALVGESGCGKSVTAMSLMGLIPSPPGRIAGGSIEFENRDLRTLPESELRKIRGNDISMIFQEPMTSMNPVFRIGSQMEDVLRHHRRLSKDEARREAVALLAQVGIPAPEERIGDYPHQMSGGMLQRVMIAMALSCQPKILIADEPTTALDVTIQAQILELLKSLQQSRGLAILLITHDLGVVEEVADEVAVMYAGKIVERSNSAAALLQSPLHPYTQGLYASLPSLQQGRARLYNIPGAVPSATQFPAGCRFHPRCPHAMPECRQAPPPWFQLEPGRGAACWLRASTLSSEKNATPTP